MKLSIIIPARNEESIIKKTLESYHFYFSRKLEFELIIIANNCTDKTPEICFNFSKGKSNVKVLNINEKIGKGGAILEGFRLAKGEYVGFVDADNSIVPSEFYKLYKNILNYDGIIASRKIKGAICERRKYKEISSLMFNMFVKMLFHLDYKDTQCGAKIFKKELTDFLLLNINEKGWIFDVDLLDLAKRYEYEIIEHPIVWYDSENSNLTTLDGVKSIFKLIKLKYFKHGILAERCDKATNCNLYNETSRTCNYAGGRYSQNKMAGCY